MTTKDAATGEFNKVSFKVKKKKNQNIKLYIWKDFHHEKSWHVDKSEKDKCKNENKVVVRAFSPLPLHYLYWCDIVFIEGKKKGLLTAAGLKAFFYSIQLKWVWGFYSSGEKRKNNKFILLLWWVVGAVVGAFDCQLRATVIWLLSYKWVWQCSVWKCI